MWVVWRKLKEAKSGQACQIGRPTGKVSEHLTKTCILYKIPNEIFPLTEHLPRNQLYWYLLEQSFTIV